MNGLTARNNGMSGWEKRMASNIQKLKKIKQFIPLYLMMLPGVLYLIINNYIPMAGIIVAFKQFNYTKGIWGSEFIGFKNFEFLFKSPDSWLITRNTICYNFAFIVIGTIGAIAVAVLLDEIKLPFAKKVYQTIILVPFLISIVIVSYIVYGFLSTETGFINNCILKALGKEPVSWYSSPRYWPFILMIVHEWKWIGYNCILYYATIVGIDKGYYEAAVIDGANRLQKIKYITLPALRPTVIILTLMSIGNIFRSDFGLFYQVPMNSGPLIDVTNTIDTYVYRGLMENSTLGMSSAAGLYQSFVGFVLVLGANLLVRKFDDENALF